MTYRNTELLSGIRADLSGRNESNIGAGMVIASYLGGIEDLRGLWPLSSADNNRAVYDVSGQERSLTVGGGAEGISTWGLISYGRCNSTTYWYRADEAALSLTGSMSMGCWFRLDALPTLGQLQCIMGKFQVAATKRSYALVYYNTGGTIAVASIISIDGTAEHYASMINPKLYEDRWHFVAMRYEPSSIHQVWLDGRAFANNVGVPAELKDNDTPFYLGAFHNGVNILDGDISLSWLSGSDVSEVVIDHLYEVSRPLFGQKGL